MAEESKKSGEEEGGQPLDLSTVSGFDDSTRWLTNNVLLGGDQEGILQLDVTLPAGGDSKDDQVTLFMLRKNGYVVGFRGHDGVYALEDDKEDCEKLLKDSGLVGKKESLTPLSIGTRHDELGTFVPCKGGTKGRRYALKDLRGAAALSKFSSKNGEVPYDDVKGALSTLVCMTVESARSRMTSEEFRNIYYGGVAQADDAMQSYDKAKRVTTLAECFPDPLVGHRVERLAKRVDEIRGLFEQAKRIALQNSLPFNQEDFVAQSLRGAAPEALKDQAKRVVHIARELRPGGQMGSSEIITLVSLCSDEAAIRGAKRGVIVPPLGHTFLR